MNIMREIPFTKMEGCGNDYVYLNAFDKAFFSEGNCVFDTGELDVSVLTQAVSNRHFGIGSDGLVLVLPPSSLEKADVRMRMFNADGTEAEMCGNASRCVGRLAWRKGLVKSPVIRLETRAGNKILHILKEVDEETSLVRVDMGRPEFARQRIPVVPESRTPDNDDQPCIEHPIHVAGREWAMTCVSMGNPHTVIFVDDVDSLDLPAIGPLFEKHPYFPCRTNTEFVQIINKEYARMRVWERGAGETLACGTGACAAAVACVLTGRAGRNIRMGLIGGALDIEWNVHSERVFMTGPARTVFSGVFLFNNGQEKEVKHDTQQ